MNKTFSDIRVSRRGLVGGAFGLGALSALSGCGGSTNGASGSNGLTEMTYISYLDMETLSVVAELMAATNGHFENHGLDVEFQVAQGSPQALQTLISGVAPLTRVGAIDLITAATDGQDLVNVGTISRGSTIQTVFSTDDPLENPEDFAGKTMGVPSEGGTSDKSLSLMLLNAGIDPEDVPRQVVGLGPGTFELVRRGDIVGYMVSIDQAINVENQFPGEAGVFETGFSVRADSQVYTATPESLDSHGDDIRSYMAGIHDALDEMLNSSNEEVLATLREDYSFASLDNDDVAPAALDRFRDLWTANGDEPLLITNEDYWEQGYQEMVDGDMAPNGFDPAEWVDNSFLPNS